MKKFAGVAGLLLALASAGVVHADQTLTTDLIQVGLVDTLVCDAVNIGPKAVDIAAAIVVVPPVGAPIDATVSATFCDAGLLGTNFVCSHTAAADAVLAGTRAYCQVVVGGQARNVRATLRNETTGEKADAR